MRIGVGRHKRAGMVGMGWQCWIADDGRANAKEVQYRAEDEAVQKESSGGVGGIGGRRCSCLVSGGHPPPP